MRKNQSCSGRWASFSGHRVIPRGHCGPSQRHHIRAMEETYSDKLLGFTIASRHSRGRAVRLGPVLDTVLSAHDYPPAMQQLLAEALTLAALIGGLLKEEGAQLTMQAQAKGGPVSLLVADYRDGDLRGYVEHDAEALDGVGANPTLQSLFGEGFLAVTFDLPISKQRYQGIVPLEGRSLAEACERYFAQSEQVPTIIRVAVRVDGDHAIAGGLLLQHLAEGEEGRERLHVKMDHPEWEHVAVMGGSIRHDELADPNLSMEALIWRLFHEEDEVRTLPGASLARGCRCTIAHFEDVIGRFPADEQAEMRNEAGKIVADCAFCAKDFELNI